MPEILSAAELAQLGRHPTTANLARLRHTLDAANTLRFTANENGIYRASALGEEDASGYQNAWLRDNVMAAFSRWHAGDFASVRQTLNGLERFLQTQTPRFQAIIANPARKEDVDQRPRIRFHAETLSELDERWANAQNDALGAVIWLRFLAANEDPAAALQPASVALYERMLHYLEAIEYWQDEDSGCWEEDRKRNASSIGIVVSAMRQVERWTERTGSAPYLRALASMLRKLGKAALAELLPFESPPQRKADAALLLLIWPFRTIEDAETEDRILNLVRARLIGERGILRYVGDSYYCQDYDEYFPPHVRSANFSNGMEYRSALLQPGREAQWCLFDSQLAAIYGQRVLRSVDADASRERMAFHLERALAQLTPDLLCPEMYYWRRGELVTNPHTPLVWAQANLDVALRIAEQVADMNPSS